MEFTCLLSSVICRRLEIRNHINMWPKKNKQRRITRSLRTAACHVMGWLHSGSGPRCHRFTLPFTHSGPLSDWGPSPISRLLWLFVPAFNSTTHHCKRKGQSSLGLSLHGLEHCMMIEGSINLNWKLVMSVSDKKRHSILKSSQKDAACWFPTTFDFLKECTHAILERKELQAGSLIACLSLWNGNQN